MNIIIQPSAKRDLKKLDKKIIELILRKLNSVRENPLEHITRLKSSRLWKFRIGDYRAILLVDTKRQEIHVIKLGHRKNIYKK